MYSDGVLWVLILAGFIWLGFLSLWIFEQRKFLKELFPKSGDRDIRKKFGELINEVSDFRKSLSRVEEKVSTLETEGLKHIQRVALIRYNPYEDTGGNISFTIALLDNKGSGMVITSLHARSESRIFAKPVLRGKAERYQFSKEEEQVVRKAMES